MACVRSLLARMRPGLVLPVLLCAATAWFVESFENFTLSSALNDDFKDVVFGGGDEPPDVDWGMAEYDASNTSIDMIVPSDHSDIPARNSEIAALCDDLMQATVLASSGPIGNLRAAGTLYGVEFDIFDDDPTTKPTSSQRLSVVGVIKGYDDLDEFRTLGLIYCFNESQYNARLSQLASREP